MIGDYVTFQDCQQENPTIVKILGIGISDRNDALVSIDNDEVADVITIDEEIIDIKWRYPELGEYPILFGEYKNKHYPQIPCLVLYKGMYGVRFWNCTEECWDDEECDDFFCKKDEVKKWMYIDALG